MNKKSRMTCGDGNEAAAYVAYKVSEVCSIYPITPSSTMAELADQWATEHQPNIWGNVPLVVEMQSEGGAAGAVHGALQSGALTTTFTASQGLLLMIPNMYKIAGELTSAVFHIAARSLATQGLSIFGDHQDVMAARSTGFAILASSSVQEAQDMAMIAHTATLQARVPFMHFFDGFRTSHEVNKYELLDEEQIRAMISDELVRAHRRRGLRPDTPFIRGTAQNPDVYFQARETVNPYYEKTPGIVNETMKHFAKVTGREYLPIQYYGAADAEYVLVAMGSGIETIKETAQYLMKQGEKVGCIQVRLYRPLSAEYFLAALPVTTKKLVVLDRTKETGGGGDPLYQDVMTCLVDNQDKLATVPRMFAGRYGLSSKEFTPAMVKGIFDELKKDKPKNHFVIGIVDDIGQNHIDYDPAFDIESDDIVRAMFFGLGSDGTVGANKNTIKIIGEDAHYYAQGYFVYDSKKSGSQTISHLRFGKHPIESPYLLQSANFIACHQYTFLHTTDLLERATEGGTFLLNTPVPKDKAWDDLPASIQRTLIDKKMRFFVIDAYKVARDSGMGARINTIMQTCFFALSGVLERGEAVKRIKKAIEKTYIKRGVDVVQKNFAAVDHTLSHLYEVPVGNEITNMQAPMSIVADTAPAFVKQVTARIMAGKGDTIPISQLPPDGTWPSGTSQWEKRNIAQEIPIWDEELCIQCGNCSLVCPHAAIRAKFYDASLLKDAPKGFKSSKVTARGFPDARYTLQVYPEDCTGCALCVDVCPMYDDREESKALNMRAKHEHLAREKNSFEFFLRIAYNDRSRVDFSNVRGAQYLEPLFEFSSACMGCGETPYLRLITQLFGDRLMVANATGCSSIYGGNLPTTPWTKNAQGRGPAWSNSLFEDNAEFGLGYRLAAVQQHESATRLLEKLRPQLGVELVNSILNAEQKTESQIQAQIQRVDKLLRVLNHVDSEEARNLQSIADQLIRRSIWIVGGDGWAYDIGYGGVDHILASGADVNVLVMDTEVYSNTGGQMSKATPLGAVAKFAAGGKHSYKKDIAMQAVAYGDVYVAHVALGADPQQALNALREAEAYRGTSLIIAYSHCIAHGIDMTEGNQQQKLAVKSGHWPLFRYNPELRAVDQNPFILDSLRPSVSLEEYRRGETRYSDLRRKHPEEAEKFLTEAQKQVYRRWALYEEMATLNADHINPYLQTVGLDYLDARKNQADMGSAV
ncbi:MAG: pyruvate:ferredoxin (flavodoxin) oxidoreductase [Burkholderiales bacterium]|jgi:pyruvate-ferredoxin/flavodoxin oxidoreductase|nr:pyruvate:ferredoxin (flavodoxin) oxidoreductase [Burkholderiales bacterium]